MRVILYRNNAIKQELEKNLDIVSDVCAKMSTACSMFHILTDKIEYFIDNYIKNVSLFKEMRDSYKHGEIYIYKFYECVKIAPRTNDNIKMYDYASTNIIFNMYTAAIDQFEKYLGEDKECPLLRNACLNISVLTTIDSKERKDALEKIEELYKLLTECKARITSRKTGGNIQSLQEKASSIFDIKMKPYIDPLKDMKNRLLK